MGKKADGAKHTSRTGKTPVKVVESTTNIFEDKRSGRDRRADEPREVAASRRESGDRRRGTIKQSSWWLQRDYVESHHFVQKSSRSRERRKGED